MWAVNGPGFDMVCGGVEVQGVVREFTSSPRIGRYSKVTCRVVLSPKSRTSPCRVSCWPDDSAIEPVVCTCGGVKADSALVIFSTAGLGQWKLSCRRWVC